MPDVQNQRGQECYLGRPVASPNQNPTLPTDRQDTQSFPLRRTPSNEEHDWNEKGAREPHLRRQVRRNVNNPHATESLCHQEYRLNPNSLDKSHSLINKVIENMPFPFVDFAARGRLDFYFLGRGAEAMSSRVAFRAASEA